MARKNEDRYTNLASATVVESAANTLTFIELLTGISLGAGIGMLIDRIDYLFSLSVLQEIVAAGDRIQCAWLTSNAPTGLDLNDRRLIHEIQISQVLVGAVVSQNHFVQPFTFGFQPAMILASPRLYLAIRGLSLASAATCTSRIHFRYIELTDKEYLELAETFILVG